MSLAKKIYKSYNVGESFKLCDVNKKFPTEPPSTIRGRIYDNLNKLFKRIGRGMYVAVSEDGENSVAVINDDGRNLKLFDDESFDAIITDHPYEDKKSNIGGSRKFVDYDCFNYILSDFIEKFRVLKQGGFLVEFFAEENANNYDYIYNCKQLAKEAGFIYYAIVPWVKGTFIANTGRKAKNSEQILFFSKGIPRKLRVDKQRGGFMSGATKMLPTSFVYQPKHPSKKIHKAEKPIELLEELLETVTLPGENVLDQFAGSGNLGHALINKKRNGVLIELDYNNFINIIENLKK